MEAHPELNNHWGYSISSNSLLCYDLTITELPACSLSVREAILSSPVSSAPQKWFSAPLWWHFATPWWTFALPWWSKVLLAPPGWSLVRSALVLIYSTMGIFGLVCSSVEVLGLACSALTTCWPPAHPALPWSPHLTIPYQLPGTFGTPMGFMHSCTTSLT